MPSQFNDEQIIDDLLERYDLRVHYCFAEFGAGDGEINCNTAMLAERGWNGVYIERDAERAQACRVLRETSRVDVVNAHLSINNINKFVLGPLDVCVIDIDGMDYHVWAAMTTRPNLVMIEYNHHKRGAYIAPYDQNFVLGRPRETQPYGASAESMMDLGNRLGYQCVGRDAGPNLFFVRNDFIRKGCL